MKSDGFRGPFGSGLVTPDAYYRLPSALSHSRSIDRMVVAHDGRPSSPILYDALIQGARASGIDVYAADVLPTPIISKWANESGCYGLMVTASHNTVSDNGLKILRPQDQLTPQQIAVIQNILRAPCIKRPLGQLINNQNEIIDSYIGWLGHHRLPRLKCLVDTAHGAWYPHVDVLSHLGLQITNLHDRWQPEAINQSGSLFISQIPSEAYDYVIAFDGDGDRLQLMQRGKLIDGDDMLHHLSFQQPDPVVGTVLANQSLAQSLSDRGIEFIRTSVGDQHVYKKLVECDGLWGGEPCGHIINRDWLNTSDPVFNLLSLLKNAPIISLPNKLYQWHHDFPSSANIDWLRHQLNHSQVRHVVRASQTEPKVRVMVEGPKETVNRLITKLFV